MIWSDLGYLLSKTKYGENSVITEFFTENHGKISGIIYGATSKKIKNYLLIGNKFHINYNSKNENKLGYLKTEIDKIQKDCKEYLFKRGKMAHAGQQEDETALALEANRIKLRESKKAQAN